jgi:SOS-response transcriptional repressor LexA
MRSSLSLGSGKYDNRVIAFIDAYWKTQYHAPTVREVAAACGISSTSVTAYTLRRLEQTGKYVLRRGKVIPVWIVEAIKGNARP